jgi:hypothetical protein
MTSWKSIERHASSRYLAIVLRMVVVEDINVCSELSGCDQVHMILALRGKPMNTLSIDA